MHAAHMMRHRYNAGLCNIEYASETHLELISPLDKMATILADDIFKCIFLNEKVRILIKISRGFVPNGLIDNT